MMQEVASDEQGMTDHLAHTNIAQQLQEAAKTDVTQASKEFGDVRPQAASMPMSPLPPPSQLPSQLTSPAHPLPPPVTGFVASGTPSKSYVPPPEMANTPPTAASQQGYMLPPGDTTTPQGGASYGTVMTPQMPPSTQSPTQYMTPPGQSPTQYMTSPVPTQMSHDTSAAVDLQVESGPMYPTPGDSHGSGGFMGWFSSGLMGKVMEKTKSSVETMITTLDPGMKQVLYSGGDLDVVVTSTKAVKVEAVCQAFQEVFGRASVKGQESQPSIAPQPVGYTAALKGAEERITNLRMTGAVREHQPVVSIESFIIELLPDKWFDIGCVILRDAASNIELEVFTQATPLPSDCVMQAQDQTPADYNLRWSGLAVTVGTVIQQRNMSASRSDWHEALTGVSRRQIIYLAAKVLAGMYQQRLQLRAFT